MSLQPTCSSSAKDADAVGGGGGKAEECVVEKILAKRFLNGKVEYQVRWEAEETWESKENLTHCPKLIAQFEKWLEEEAKKQPKRGKKKAASVVPTLFFAEKIVGKRVHKGKTEYFVKWKGFEEKDNTWEPKDSFEGPSLINDYEEELKRDRKKKSKKGGRPSSSSTNDPDAESGTQELAGFDRGLEPEKIVGASDSTGELLYSVKWKDLDEAENVPAEQVNSKCPSLVIAFYEGRKAWLALANPDLDESAALEPKLSSKEDLSTISTPAGSRLSGPQSRKLRLNKKAVEVDDEIEGLNEEGVEKGPVASSSGRRMRLGSKRVRKQPGSPGPEASTPKAKDKDSESVKSGGNEDSVVEIDNSQGQEGKGPESESEDEVAVIPPMKRARKLSTSSKGSNDSIASIATIPHVDVDVMLVDVE